jgi:hypothetical protein
MTRLGGRLLVRRADLRAAGLLGRNRLVGRQSFIWSAIDLPVGIALLARNRLTRTAAERRFVLSGECGQGQFFGRSAVRNALLLAGAILPTRGVRDLSGSLVS